MCWLIHMDLFEACQTNPSFFLHLSFSFGHQQLDTPMGTELFRRIIIHPPLFPSPFSSSFPSPATPHKLRSSRIMTAMCKERGHVRKTKHPELLDFIHTSTSKTITPSISLNIRPDHRPAFLKAPCCQLYVLPYDIKVASQLVG